MSSGSSRKKSITLRIDHAISNVLENHAKKNNASVNSLVNQILHEYVDWHMQASSSGHIYFRKSLLAALVDKIDEKDIDALAANDVENTKESMYMLRKKCDLDVAIEVFESWLRGSHIEYTKDIDVASGVHTIAIHLGMNKKSSLLIAEYCRHLFERLGANRVECDTTNTMLIVRMFPVLPKDRYT